MKANPKLIETLNALLADEDFPPLPFPSCESKQHTRKNLTWANALGRQFRATNQRLFARQFCLPRKWEFISLASRMCRCPLIVLSTEMTGSAQKISSLSPTSFGRTGLPLFDCDCLC